MRILHVIFLGSFASAAFAETGVLEQTVMASFDNMPRVVRLNDLSDICGADGQANADVVFCTSKNTVFMREGGDSMSYKLAHVMGHAVQVRHGIADIALREITKRRDEEQYLRGLVTRQVECIAGFLMAKANLPEVDFAGLTQEPFTGSHWGRNPLRLGPKVSIGTAARAEWFTKGYRGETLAVCAVGEMGAELLLKAYRG